MTKLEIFMLKLKFVLLCHWLVSFYCLKKITDETVLLVVNFDCYNVLNILCYMCEQK